jgi:hypothetical protein
MSPGNLSYHSKGHTFLKSEAFIAALLDRGFSYDKLVVQRAGSFAKSYRNDIENVSVKRDTSDQDILYLTINRDGIYDRLPEGLFHQPRAVGSKTTVSQMVSEHRLLREEEKAARLFFQPLEHELFRYAVFIEQEERAFFGGMLSGNLDNAFSRFWNLQPGLPAVLTASLARIMPWAYLIKGDAALCAKALEIILSKPVAVVVRIVEQHFKEEAYRLGEGELGVDMLSGNSFLEPAVCWVFTIKELGPEEMSAFVGNEKYGKFLRQFIDIFIPLEADAVFEYEVNKEGSEGTEDVLGYSFVL